MLKSVDIKMNKVWINYDEFRLFGDNWDHIEYKFINNHDAVITKSWMNSEESMDFITKQICIIILINVQKMQFLILQ